MQRMRSGHRRRARNRTETETNIETKTYVTSRVERLRRPEYDSLPEALRGLEGIQKANEVLRENGAVGVLIGGVLRTLGSDEITEQTLLRKDTDVLILNPDTWSPKNKWQDNIDWFRQFSGGVPAIAGAGRFAHGDKVAMKHVNFAYTIGVDQQYLSDKVEPGLYVPGMQTRINIWKAEMAKLIAETFFTDEDFHNEVGLESSIIEVYERAYPENRDMIFDFETQLDLSRPEHFLEYNVFDRVSVLRSPDEWADVDKFDIRTEHGRDWFDQLTEDGETPAYDEQQGIIRVNTILSNLVLMSDPWLGDHQSSFETLLGQKLRSHLGVDSDAIVDEDKTISVVEYNQIIDQLHELVDLCHRQIEFNVEWHEHLKPYLEYLHVLYLVAVHGEYNDFGADSEMAELMRSELPVYKYRVDKSSDELARIALS